MQKKSYVKTWIEVSVYITSFILYRFCKLDASHSDGFAWIDLSSDVWNSLKDHKSNAFYYRVFISYPLNKMCGKRWTVMLTWRQIVLFSALLLPDVLLLYLFSSNCGAGFKFGKIDREPTVTISGARQHATSSSYYASTQFLLYTDTIINYAYIFM